MSAQVLIARGAYKAFAVRHAVEKLAIAFEASATEAQHLRSVLGGDDGPSESKVDARERAPQQPDMQSASKIPTQSNERDVGKQDDESGDRWRLLRDRHALLLEPAAVLAHDISQWLTLVARAKNGDLPLFTAGDSPQAVASGAGSGVTNTNATSAMKRSTPANFLLGHALVKPATVNKELTAKRLGLFDDDDYSDSAIDGNMKTTSTELYSHRGDNDNPKWHGLLSTSGRNACSGCSE